MSHYELWNLMVATHLIPAHLHIICTTKSASRVYNGFTFELMIRIPSISYSHRYTSTRIYHVLVPKLSSFLQIVYLSLSAHTYAVNHHISWSSFYLIYSSQFILLTFWVPHQELTFLWKLPRLQMTLIVGCSTVFFKPCVTTHYWGLKSS